MPLAVIQYGEPSFGLRCEKLHIVVEGDVGVACVIADHTDRFRFAALSRPMHQGHRGVGQGLLQTAACKARIEYMLSLKPDGLSHGLFV